MVLINGVKYACERCIRGHRVTTCTHTDQPLMMIKPKGRPSTQCNHCKEVRKLKNSHVTCTCKKKLDSKLKDHQKGCACHVDGNCSCGMKSKKSLNKKKEFDSNLNLNFGKKMKINKDLDPDNEKDTNQNMIIQPNEQITLQSIEMTTHNNTNDATMATANSDWQNNESTSGVISDSISNMKLSDRDTINGLLHSWDLSSPPMGTSESITSLNSLLSDGASSRNNNNNTVHKSARSASNDYQYFTKRQVGMDPIQNFRSGSKNVNNAATMNNNNSGMNNIIDDNNSNNTNNNNNNNNININNTNNNNNHNNNNNNNINNNNHISINNIDNNNAISNFNQLKQKRIGEISIPVDEYVAPLNNMNTHLTNFLNNFNDSSPNDPTVSPDDVSPPFSNSNDYSTEPKGNLSDLYDIPPPTPGNGLLDIFDENLANSRVYTNHSRNFSTHSVLSSPHAHENNGPDSLFPLYPLIGPSFSQSSVTSPTPQLSANHTGNSQVSNLNNIYGSKLSYSNLNSHNMKSSPINNSSNQYHHSQQQNLLQQAATQSQMQAFPELFRNMTGSSTHSTNSHHSHHSSSHHHHHGGSHGHSHQSHFQPYPTAQPRRSSSFLSVSSANTIGSSIGSPSNSSSYEVPQMLTAENADMINGLQLSNAKTNTTLMDDIYQTKTYTDAVSLSLASQSETNNKNKNSVLINNKNNFNDEKDHLLSPKHVDVKKEDNGQFDNNLDLSMIGTIPMTSSSFMNDFPSSSKSQLQLQPQLQLPLQPQPQPQPQPQLKQQQQQIHKSLVSDSDEFINSLLNGNLGGDAAYN